MSEVRPAAESPSRPCLLVALSLPGPSRPSLPLPLPSSLLPPISTCPASAGRLLGIPYRQPSALSRGHPHGLRADDPLEQLPAGPGRVADRGGGQGNREEDPLQGGQRSHGRQHADGEDRRGIKDRPGVGLTGDQREIQVALKVDVSWIDRQGRMFRNTRPSPTWGPGDNNTEVRGGPVPIGPSACGPGSEAGMFRRRRTGRWRSCWSIRSGH